MTPDELQALTPSFDWRAYFRRAGVVSNMPEFQKAFSCKPDAPMVRANPCRVW